MYTADGKHSRRYKSDEQTGLRKVRSSKHRYVYFCTNSKRTKRFYMENLRYPILPYPKGDNNTDYQLGDFLKDEIVADKRSERNAK